MSNDVIDEMSVEVDAVSNASESNECEEAVNDIAAEAADIQPNKTEMEETSTVDSGDVNTTASETNDNDTIAIVLGQAITTLPQDLYIPPDALQVFLEAFEGPLDLLLYLIKRQNINILDIPIADITHQYMGYVDLMKDIQLELAAEYLVMAAMLAEIKSRLLLPRPVFDDEDENDPRADLIRRLQEYERFKTAAVNLDELPREGRDTFEIGVAPPDYHVDKPLPDVDLKDLLLAFSDVMKRVKLQEHHTVARETLSIRERMSNILAIVKADEFTVFTALFTVEEGRMGVVVTFIAVLELIRESVLELVQAEPFAPIHIKAVA